METCSSEGDFVLYIAGFMDTLNSYLMQTEILRYKKVKKVKVKVKVIQSHYRPEVAQSVPGS